MANIRDFVKLFLKELENFTDVWSKTKKQDINDFNRFTKDFGRRAKREPFLSYQVIKDKTALTEISSQIQKDFSHFGKYIDQKISHEMKRGLVDEIPRSQLMERVKREIRQGKRYAYTWVNTSENAINTTKRLNENVESGYKYFQYSGAKPDRDFCRQHFEKVYTLEEIGELDNGQGLDVLYYRGGYNCRHRWRPISEKDALALRNAPPPKAGDPPKATETKGAKVAENPQTIARRIGDKFTKHFGPEVKLGRNVLGTKELLNREKILNKLFEEYETTIISKNLPVELDFQSDGNVLGFVRRYSSGAGRMVVKMNFGDKPTTWGSIQRGESARVDENKLGEYVTTHEFAHVISVRQDAKAVNHPDYLKYNKFWSGVRKIKSNYTREWRKAARSGREEWNKYAESGEYLGNYANENLSEFLAEAFTNYRLSSSPSSHAVKVGELFDENFKRSK